MKGCRLSYEIDVYKKMLHMGQFLGFRYNAKVFSQKVLSKFIGFVEDYTHMNIEYYKFNLNVLIQENLL